MKNIVIFSNCFGGTLKGMFEAHKFTKNEYSIEFISNYEYFNKPTVEFHHINMLQACDIFIYQPCHNFIDSEYDISNIKKYLRCDTIILKVNFYRFKGFWYDSEYKPFHEYKNYKFYNMKHYGLHNSFVGFQTTDSNIVTNKIQNIRLCNDDFFSYFNCSLEQLKSLDNDSDISMFNYFVENYKIKRMFHDPYHPTNLFFYEMFRQLVDKISNVKLKQEDYDFIDTLEEYELTHWALPILPIIKKTLELALKDQIYIFYPPYTGDKKLYMDVYDYYYIRLLPSNFQKYLNNREFRVY